MQFKTRPMADIIPNFVTSMVLDSAVGIQLLSKWLLRLSSPFQLCPVTIRSTRFFISCKNVNVNESY